MHECCRIENGLIHLAIKALPGASKTEVAGVQDGRLKLRVAAAPEGGRANAALIAFIAGALGCPKHRLCLLRGEKSRLKTLAIPFESSIQLEKFLSEVLS